MPYIWLMSTRKKVKFKSIGTDPEHFALVVHYCSETPVVDDQGNSTRTDREPGQKVVRVPHAFAHDEIPVVAKDIADKCRYIPATRVGEVEQALYVLLHETTQRSQDHLNRHHGPETHASGHGLDLSTSSQKTPPHSERSDLLNRPETPHRRDGMWRSTGCLDGSKMQQYSSHSGRRTNSRQEALLPEADMNLLGEYMDQLYEEKMELKVQAAKCILCLCTDARALEVLEDHDSLLGVLSRELRESLKKSFELSVVIVCAFLCFSQFSQFHSALMRHQCGDVTMRVLEYESQRHQVRRDDLERKRQSILEKGDAAASDLGKDERKFRMQVRRQSKLIYVCVTVLLHLAEDTVIEKKMVNRKMVTLLTGLLDRTQDDLLFVSCQFLKKLSIFEENKKQICSPEALARFVQLSGSSNVHTALLALRTIYNISFDDAVRASLVESGILKSLVDHLKNPPFRHIVLRLLYHFSLDDRCKSLMPYYQEGISMLLQLVVHFPEPRLGKDLVALLINLSTHPRGAQVMLESGVFTQVIQRALRTRDPLLCKVIRHVSSHKHLMETMLHDLQSENVRMTKWMCDYVRMAVGAVDNPDLLIEALGTLANMSSPDVMWGELCEAGLVDLLHRLLMVGFSDDDMILECIIIVGNIALSNDDGPAHIMGSRLLGLLQELLVEKCEDQEIALQLLFSFECLLTHHEIREMILEQTDVAAGIMRFAQLKSLPVARQAVKTLEVLAEFIAEYQVGNGEEPWTDQIKNFLFEHHNPEWSRMIDRARSGTGVTVHGAYFDEPKASGEEEDDQEFAFRWAGGDAAGIDDLANRNWENEDLWNSIRSTAPYGE